MMKRSFALSLLTGAFAVVFASASAFAQDWSTLQTCEDEAVLIQAIEKPGDSPEDIHNKNVACKRLSKIGTEKAIPALVAMLSNEKLNFNGRFALEAMPFASVDEAFAKAAGELDGYCLVGVVDSIGVRGKAESVALLKKLAETKTDAAVRKAIYAACGMIATDEAVDFLVAESKTDALKSADFIVVRGLGDAILDVAEAREKAGDKAAAATLYAAATADVFPKFEREAGLYRSLLCNGADSAAKVVELINGDDASASDVAIKTIREFDEAAGTKVVEAILAAFDSFPEAKQVYVARALGDRKDDASKKLVFPKLVALGQNGSVALKTAAAQALKKAGSIDEVKAFAAFVDGENVAANFEDAGLSDAIVALGSSFQSAEFAAVVDKFATEKLQKAADEQPEALVLAALKVAENRRVEAAGPALVKIAESKTGAVRDGALAALSEIVSLDNLNLLVEALNGETDDAKVDWILRAACTRMPREECAAKVAELFGKSDLAGKIKILPLLKQIGGQTALFAVANACNGDTLDKATQILGEWNTPDDASALADVCLAIAKQAKDAKYHSRGIRGYIRVARQFDLPVDVKIAMCKTAFETAKRADDKALIFEVFKRNIIADNVVAALEYAQYDEYKEAACEAAVFVAEKIRVSQADWDWAAKTDDAAKAKAGADLIAGMKKVVETTANADLKARAQKLL